MPILSIDSDTLKKALTKLGIPIAIATAIVAYFLSIQLPGLLLPAKYMTYEEYRSTIATYNAKIQMIKGDCKNDKRCKDDKVLFTGVKTKEDVINKLNVWIADDFEDANTYKITPVKEIER